MRVRLVFALIALLTLAGIFFWYSPYHQVRSIVTVVDINAPGNRVWQVLTDLDGYRAWNPFLTSASGAIAGMEGRLVAAHHARLVLVALHDHPGHGRRFRDRRGWVQRGVLDQFAEVRYLTTGCALAILPIVVLAGLAGGAILFMFTLGK